MKIIIAGGRDYVPQRRHVKQILDILVKNNHTEIVSGECDSGADVFGEMISLFHRVKITMYPANWERHGKKAGPMRNEKMAEYADGCILLPGGSGTANMKMNAEKYGLKIWEIK